MTSLFIIKIDSLILSVKGNAGKCTRSIEQNVAGQFVGEQ
jgi:hypothetical protein